MKKLRTPFITTACLTLLALVSYADTKYPVVSGQSVGKVLIGATRDSVAKSLGAKPSKSVKWKNGLVQDTWLGPKPANDEYGIPVSERTFLYVVYRDNKVVQIEYNSPNFVTAQGVSIRSSLAQFRAKHKNLKVRAYSYDGPEGGGYIGYYYDDVKRGIAFEFGVQDNFDARTTPDSLRVHKPGQSVIPDPGGEPMKATDEIPVRPEEN